MLAQRLAIPEAQHPRVPEPTAKSALADSGPREVASVGADAMALDALNVMAERDVSAVAVVSPAGIHRNFLGAGPCAKASAREPDRARYAGRRDDG